VVAGGLKGIVSNDTETTRIRGRVMCAPSHWRLIASESELAAPRHSRRRTAAPWQPAPERAQIRCDPERRVDAQLEFDLHRRSRGRNLRCEIAGGFCAGYAAGPAGL